MMRRGTIGLAWMVSALLLAGCTSHRRIGFDPASLAAAPRRGAPPMTDRALLVMNAMDAGWVYEGLAAKTIDTSTKIKFEVGEITRQAALQVLGAAFRDGVEFRNDAGDTQGYAVIVTPKVDKFTFSWKEIIRLERLVLAAIPFMGYSPPIRPWIEMEMHVEFRSPDGRLWFETTCKSGRVFGNQVESAIEWHGKKELHEMRRHFHLTVAGLLETAVAEFEKQPRP